MKYKEYLSEKEIYSFNFVQKFVMENSLVKQVKQVENHLFSIKDNADFSELALEVFRFQYSNNLVYKQYVDNIGIEPDDVKSIFKIPFLPIEFFKTHKIMLKGYDEEIVFLSSGTTGINQSKHFVVSEALYKRSFFKGFNFFYGDAKDYCFLALLPGYIERKGSSLIYMVEQLMHVSKHADNGFYLNEYEQLASKLKNLQANGQKYMIIGVTYALLDFAKLCSIDLSDGIVLETGGMKGKRKELTKNEVHSQLELGFHLKQVHSEYGMTELLSQAYSKGNGLFSTPKWMKVLIRDTYDPFSYLKNGKSGGINVIDLANLYSCSFVETKDLGRLKQNGQFEVLGRFDNSDIRGCNLLVN